jgi:hypothetical protein
MELRISWVLALGILAAQGVVFAQASFSRVQLNTQFYSEGIVTADLNKDGAVDVLAGPYWYPGPSFETKLAFRAPRTTPFATSGDSDCYALFVFDFNGDGWPDILSFRTSGGAEAVWYQNPGSPSASTGVWTERVAYGNVDSESPIFADVDGDARPEIVTTAARFGGWVKFDPANPNVLWTFKSVTAQGPASWDQYTHGTGAGDVNGDGRTDLLFPEGWWEQPAASSATPWTQHAAAFWGKELAGEDAGGAQMHVYDVDGDGDQDVVTSLQAHGWGLAWFENQGGAFTKRMILNTRADTALYGAAFAQLHAVALADLDGDGLKDIVTGKRKGAHGNGLSSAELNGAPVLYWLKLTRPAGQPPRFEPRLIDSASGIGTQITVADVNGDGRPDILTAARQGAFVFLNQMSVSTRRGRGPGFTPPFRGDLVPVDRDATGRKRPEEACRECLAP